MTIRLLPVVLVLAVAAVGLVVADGGATAAKAAPFCKTGQKSTTAHPCVKPPRCKPGQKSTRTHPCTKTTSSQPSTTKTTGGTTSATGSTSGGGTSTTSAGTTTPAAGGGGGGAQANGCAAGQQIPQGTLAGDGDEDNAGMPDDGDGCL